MKALFFWLTLALVSVGEPLVAQTVLKQDFESLASGSVLGAEGWTIPKGYGSEPDFTVQNHRAHGGSQALQIRNASGTSQNGNLRVRFSCDVPGYGVISPAYLAAKETNNFWIDASLLPPGREADGFGTLALQLTVAPGTVSFTFCSDGTINHASGAKYKESEWNRLTLHVFVVSVNNGNYDLTAQVYLNGVQLTFGANGYKGDPGRIALNASGKMLLGVSNDLAQIRQIGLGYSAASSTGDGGFLDDLQVTLNNPLEN